MFSGMVEANAKLLNRDQDRWTFQRPEPLDDLHLGSSVALNGCCLTVVACDEATMTFEISPETFQRTSFQALAVGDMANVERALLPTTRLDGHLVSGHIDGKAQILSIEAEGAYHRFAFKVEDARYLIAKGSVAIDGISLTVNGVQEGRFDVMIIPHTLKATNLAARKVGDWVNVEYDMAAKYIQKHVEAYMKGVPNGRTIGID